MTPHSSSFVVGLALLFAAGCGNEPDPVALGPCAAKLAECLSSQQTCVEDTSGARCESCATGKFAAAEGCLPLKGIPLVHDFAELTVGPGEEVGNDDALCQSWTLNNPEEIWVNAVELEQDELSHHSIWTYVPSTSFEGPDGIWKCTDRGYTSTGAAIAGGVLYAQSTQAPHEVQRFPNDAAIRIAPYSRIIGDIHLLNASTESVTGHARLTLYTLAAQDVGVKLVPFQLHYRDIHVPAHASTRLFGECDLDSRFLTASGEPFQMDLYYVLPHTHQRGKRLFIDILGGPDDKKRIFDVGAYNGEARGRAYDKPVHVANAQGFRWGCEYENPSDTTYEWGYNLEMCQFLGFADMKVGFSSRIDMGAEVPPDGDMLQFTGACNTLAVLWDYNKAGGTPP